MNTPFYKNSKFIKWSLFLSLVLALGANLSLNPQTQYIARNGVEKIDLASAAVKRDSSKDEKFEFKENQTISFEVEGNANNANKKVTVNIKDVKTKEETSVKKNGEYTSEEKITITATVKSIPEGTWCESCLEKSFTASGVTSAAVLAELSKQINEVAAKALAEKSKKEKEEKDKEKDKEKFASREEINRDVDKIINNIVKNNKCSGGGITQAERFDCYATNLIDISDALSETEYADSPIGESVMRNRINSYYQKYLSKNFRSGFASMNSPWMNGDSVNYFQTRNLAGELFNSLDGAYSSKIISDIEMAQAQGYSIRAQNAYQMMNSKNPFMALNGHQQLLNLQASVGADANFATGNLVANGTMGLDELNMVSQYFYQPTSAMLQNISKKISISPAGSAPGTLPVLTADDFKVDTPNILMTGNAYESYNGVLNYDSFRAPNNSSYSGGYIRGGPAALGPGGIVNNNNSATLTPGTVIYRGPGRSALQ